MAVDPEFKAIMNALVEGQVKLAEGQERQESSIARLEDVVVKLANGQERHEALLVKLAEGQARHETILAKLAVGQAQHEEVITRLANSVEAMGEHTERQFELVHERMDRSDERMEKLTEAIVRGFTDAAKRDKDLDERVSALE